jgi:hypothetical protein
MAYPQNQSGIYPVDPIDSLQTLYDQWKQTVSVSPAPDLTPSDVKVYTNPSGTTVFDFTLCRDYTATNLVIFDVTGRKITEQPVSSRIMMLNLPDDSHGMLIYQVVDQYGLKIVAGKFFR